MSFGAYGSFGRVGNVGGYGAGPAIALPGLTENNRVDFAEGPPMANGAQVHAFDDWARMTDPQRVAWMRNMVREYEQDPRFAVLVTGRIFSPMAVAPRDYPAQAAALLRWVQGTIYYVNEPGERIQSPWRTLEMGCGDCDDLAVLLATLAGSIAMPNRFVLIGYKGTGRNRKMVRWVEGTPVPKGVSWIHITVDLGWPFGRPTHWAATEPTMRGAPLGYDVTMHGMQMDGHGRPHLPPSFGGPTPAELRFYSPAGGQAQQAFMGDIGALPQTLGNGEEQPGFLRRFFSLEFGQNLTVSVVEAVVTALAVSAALSYFSRRRR